MNSAAAKGPAVSGGAIRMPAEWEPQQCVWIAWPHNRETWPGRFGPIPDFFARWVHLIAESTPVRIVASGEAWNDCRQRLGHAPHNIELIDLPTNDCWIRDYGPSFVFRDGQLEAVNWRFNAWGGKYAPWDQDDALAARLCERLGLSCLAGSLCLEGGALEVDGQGRMLTTDCLVSPTRNPGFSREQVAAQLHRFLGVTEVVWVDGGGLEGDDTDGHIDQLARFATAEHVVVAVSDDHRNSNHAGLQQNYRQLQIWGDSTEPAVEVHRLPIPPARYVHEQRVPESYCNFLRLGPERLLVPTFDADTDDHAVGLLAELTGCDVTPVPSSDLAWGLGALHCASRDMPRLP